MGKRLSLWKYLGQKLKKEKYEEKKMEEKITRKDKRDAEDKQ